MSKGMKQKLRRLERLALEAKWNPTLKHGLYNVLGQVTDGVQKIRELRLGNKHNVRKQH